MKPKNNIKDGVIPTNCSKYPRENTATRMVTLKVPDAKFSSKSTFCLLILSLLNLFWACGENTSKAMMGSIHHIQKAITPIERLASEKNSTDQHTHKAESKDRQDLNQIREEIRKIKVDNNLEAVFIIGNTRVGKTKFLESLNNHYNLSLELDDQIVSEHNIPQKYIINNTLFWDIPGIFDDEDFKNEIYSLFYFKSILESTNRSKFIFTVTEDDFAGQANSFFSLIRGLGKIFIDYNQLKGQFCLLVTQSTNKYSQKLKGILTNFVAKKKGLNHIEKQILTEIAEYTPICFFDKIPNDETIDIKPENGNINLHKQNAADKNVEQKEIELQTQNYAEIFKILSKIQFKKSPQITIALSADSRLKLDKISKEIVNNIERYCKEINENLKEISTKIIHENQFNIATKKLNDIKNKLEALNNGSLEDFLEIHELIDDENQKNDLSNKVRELIKEHEYLTNLSKESQLKINLYKILDSIKLLSVWLEKPKTQLIEDTLQISGHLLSSQGIGYIINRNSNLNFRTINILCADTFYCNSNITIPGKNLNILTRNFYVDKESEISLKGNNAPKHINTKALNGKSILPNGKGEDGMKGLQGNPGENGGNLYIKCYLSKNINLLSIDVSGGNGGKGQDGGDGANGKNGDDGDLSRLYKRKFEDIISSSVVKKPFVDNILSYNTIYIREYECSGLEGTPAGVGGHGGMGGYCGFAGQVMLDGINEMYLYKVIKNNGSYGKKGADGKTGVGGLQGCTYYGKYQSEELFTFFKSEKIKEACTYLNHKDRAAYLKSNISTIAPAILVNGCFQVYHKITIGGIQSSTYSILSNLYTKPFNTISKIVNPVAINKLGVPYSMYFGCITTSVQATYSSYRTKSIENNKWIDGPKVKSNYNRNSSSNSVLICYEEPNIISTV